MLNHINDTYPAFNTHIDNDTDSDSEDTLFDAIEELDGMNSSLSKRKRNREDDTANPGPTKMVHKNSGSCISSSSSSSSSSSAMIREILEASNWNEPGLITENTGNCLFGAVSSSETVQLKAYCDLDANFHGHLFSRNYLLDWIILLHGVFKFLQSYLKLRG